MKRKSGRSARKTAYALALAGSSAALALLFVWLGVVVRYVTVAMFAAAGVAVMAPVTKKYYASAVFAYLVSAGLGFLVGDVTTVAGYAIYFGPMALISAVMWEKNVKWFVSYPVKIVWINAAVAALYYGLGAMEVLAPDLAAAMPYWAIAIVATIALLLIDLLMTYAYRTLKTVTAKVIRDKDGGEATAEDIARAELEDMDPFGRDEEEDDARDGAGKRAPRAAEGSPNESGERGEEEEKKDDAN